MSKPVTSCSGCAYGEGALDQYSDGVGPDVWELCIGDTQKRVGVYRNFLTKLLRSNRCNHILDVSCGTGVDSVMLLEEGFRLTSVDLSYKMLRYARDIRWDRRKEPAFDSWVIKEANWLTLQEDLEGGGPFDALVCLGNSFVALLDSSEDQSLHKQALRNFSDMMRPGGLLVIDHLNFDSYLDGKDGGLGKNIYYNGEGIKIIKTTTLFEDGRPCEARRTYEVDVSCLPEDLANKYRKYNGSKFSVRIFPHRLADFQRLLKDVFGPSAKYHVFGEYKPLNQIENPAFYVHVVQKPL